MTGVTTRYLGYPVTIHDERHVTIHAPDGTPLVRNAQMNDATVRAFVRGYRRQDRTDKLCRPTTSVQGHLEPGEVRP